MAYWSALLAVSALTDWLAGPPSAGGLVGAIEPRSGDGERFNQALADGLASFAADPSIPQQAPLIRAWLPWEAPLSQGMVQSPCVWIVPQQTVPAEGTPWPDAHITTVVLVFGLSEGAVQAPGGNPKLRRAYSRAMLGAYELVLRSVLEGGPRRGQLHRAALVSHQANPCLGVEGVLHTEISSVQHMGVDDGTRPIDLLQVTIEVITQRPFL